MQVSPASSSPTLTELGRQGKTNGIFFRTITSDALQGVAAARYAIDQGFKTIAIVDVNTDFGVNLAKQFTAAYTALGGKITASVPYNEKQASYDSEATAAMAGSPDGLYLISTPVDGATIARAWISAGGPQKFLLNDGMNSDDFIASVGAQYLENAYGTSSGTTPTASTHYFEETYKAFSGLDPAAPAADRSYDAAAVVGLAVAAAGSKDPLAIRDAIYKVTDPKGTPVGAGKDEFAKALAMIKDGKPIRYEGVIGPDELSTQYGDITGPFRLWKITDGTVVTDGRDEHRRRERPQGQDRRPVSAAAEARPCRRCPASRSRPDLDDPAHRHRPVAGRRPGAFRRSSSIPSAAPTALAAYAAAGFDAFDMADHYGSAETHRRPASVALPSRGCQAAARLHEVVPGARPHDGRRRAGRGRAIARPPRRRPDRPPAVPLVDLRASRLPRRRP